MISKKMLIILLSLSVYNADASKLSKFLNKMDEEQKQKESQELRQDMNFNDFAFRLNERYVDNKGQHCRDYEFRGRSNPYKHGFLTACDDR